MSSLPLGKAVGMNGINNRVLRGLVHKLSFPLCSLLNQSIRLGHFSDIWKDALFCPKINGEDPTQVFNCRPISLLSYLE